MPAPPVIIYLSILISHRIYQHILRYYAIDKAGEPIYHSVILSFELLFRDRLQQSEIVRVHSRFSIRIHIYPGFGMELIEYLFQLFVIIIGKMEQVIFCFSFL